MSASIAPAAAAAPPGTTVPAEYARIVGRFAYAWAWPMVNMHHRREAMDKVPEPGLVGGIVPAAPVNSICMLTDYVDPGERIVATPNQDVVYGFGLLSLDRSPVVVQVPDFGGRFWVYQAADGRTEGYARLGAMYGSEPGHYLLVGPGWAGSAPAGIRAVFRSPTAIGALIPRLFMDDTPADRRAVQPLVHQVAAYPLAEFDGTMKRRDWSAVPRFPAAGDGQGEVRWVDPDTFWDVLPGVLDETPPRPGEDAVYAQTRALLAAARSDPAVMAALRDAAAETEAGLLTELFEWRNQGIPLPHGWTTMTDAARWGTDYLTRLSAAKANIFSNAPEETAYFALDLDPAGGRLSGARGFTLTFPAGGLPPVRGFWSLTAYNAHHFFEPNPLNRHSVGTKNKDLAFGGDGSLTLWIAPEPPADPALRPNWLPAPRGDFSLYLRAYWPEAAITERRWTPPPLAAVA